MSTTAPTRSATPASGDPRDDARAVGLRYVSDDRPGITRHRSGRGFTYGTRTARRSATRRDRRASRAIAIPPAWTDVWICPNPRGHILATGRDARGRKQYRYHPRLARAARRDEVRPDGRRSRGALPPIRARSPTISRCAGCRARRCSPPSCRLHRRHADPRRQRGVRARRTARSARPRCATTTRRSPAASCACRFRGKRGKEHEVAIDDPRLARIVRRCQELPGEQLFGYLDETGAPRAIDSGDVNDYLREVAGEEITVKDFRTWGGSVLCHQLLLRRRARPTRGRGEAHGRRVDQGRGRRASATPPPSAARATSTRRCSTRTSTARSRARAAGGRTAEHGLRPEERRLRSFLAGL